MPPQLAKRWHTRGYYGSTHHNVRAVYTYYLGLFDGNPADLHPLHPVEASEKYVAFMGGARSVVERAKVCFEQGDYRWVATVLNHVVMAGMRRVHAPRGRSGEGRRVRLRCVPPRTQAPPD